MADNTSTNQDTPVTQDPPVTADNLINKVISPGKTSSGQPTDFTPPEGFDESQFNTMLKAVTGVEDYKAIPKLKSEYEQLSSRTKSATEELAALRQKVQQYEDRLRLPVHSNEFVKRIDDFFKEQRTPQEIRRFMELHSKDVTSMQPLDALVQKMMMENPGVSELDARVLIENDYVPQPLKDDATDAERRVYERQKQLLESKLKVDGQSAKNWLEQQITSFDNPQLQAQQKIAQQKQQMLVNEWNRFNSTILNPNNFEGGITMSFELKSDKIGGEYKHPGFKPNLTPEMTQELTQLLTNYAIQNNIPLHESSTDKLIEYRDAILRNYFYDDFIESLLIDYHASLSAYFLEQYSTPSGRQQPRPERNRPQPQTGQRPTAPRPGEQYF